MRLLVRGIHRYSVVLSTPQVGRLVLAALLTYMAQSASLVVTVILLRDACGSYAVAGAAIGARSFGAMVAAPFRGRLVDRLGQKRVLPLLGTVHVSGLVLLAFAAMSSTPLLVVLSAVIGAAFPPVYACMRSLWSSIFEEQDKRNTAYALEAALQDLSLLGGPLLATALLLLLSSQLALLATATLISVGVPLFVSAPAAREWRAAHGGCRASFSLSSAGMRTLVLGMFFFGAATGVLEIGIPSFAEFLSTPGSSAGPVAALLLTCLAAGSLVGGLSYGLRRWSSSISSICLFLLLALTVWLFVLPFASSTLQVGVGLTIVGATMAPVVAVSYSLLDSVAPRGTSTESFAWIASALMGGASVGAFLSGMLSEAAGTRIALLASAGFAGLAVVVVSTRRSTLRGGE